MDNEQAREVRRLRKLLERMMELANHVEQTGSFESGAHDSVRRYNAIVERLENIDAISENTFPQLDKEADFGRLGAECTLLSGYLEDLLEEEEPEDMPPHPRHERQARHGRHGRHGGIGEIVALAPFLGSEELHKLVQSHFVGKIAQEENDASEEEDAAKPDMKYLIALAPHMASEDLEQLVMACLSRQSNFSPKYLSALAPHLSSDALGRILREYLPNWFEGKSEKQETKAEPPPSNEPPKTGGGDAWTSLTRIS